MSHFLEYVCLIRRLRIHVIKCFEVELYLSQPCLVLFRALNLIGALRDASPQGCEMKGGLVLNFKVHQILRSLGEQIVYITF